MVYGASHVRGPGLSYEGFLLARRIARESPDRIVFADEFPNPGPLIEEIASLMSGRLPTLIIHLFGSFYFQLDRWLQAAPALREFSIAWLCASRRQGAHASLLFERDTASIVPFPVDTEVFRHDRAARSRLRQEIGATERTRVLLYSGRITLAKQARLLLEEFSTYCSRERGEGRDARLLVAGEFDDLGFFPFVGNLPSGTYFRWVDETLSSLTADVGERITFLGFLPAARLAEVYSASDLGVCLSLHHDEDFGMAAAEGLCSGLPQVLTSWGGLAAFEEMDAGACRCVSVGWNGDSLSVSREEIQRALRSFSEGSADREGIARRYADKLSIASVAALLRSELERERPKFAGFSSFAGELREAGALARNYERAYASYRA
jgi:glycosyltransferase involved in cell wall biosynthesis